MPVAKRLSDLFPYHELRENGYYGHGKILREYAGVRLPYRINGSIQHGWHEGAGIYSAPEKDTDELFGKRYYVWTTDNVLAARERGFRNVVALGAPFIYMPPMPCIEPKPSSLILFLGHGSEWEPLNDPIADYRRFFETHAEILAGFSNVTISLYWLEYENKDLVRYLERLGLKVVTMGHRDNNPAFLDNFRRHVSEHEFFGSNYYFTATFYALHMGMKTFVLPSDFDLNWSDFRPRMDAVQETMIERYPQLLYSNFNGECHRWISDYELGVEYKRSPKDLRRMFEWSPRVSRRISRP